MIVVFVGLIFFVLVSVFIVNSSFLEKYYVANKQTELTAMYSCMEKAIEEENISTDDMQAQLSHMSEKANISAIVVSIEELTDSQGTD